MKLQSLSTLTSVIEHGSFAAAAEHVSVTPSAVSLQMKLLEDYFRQPLFDRSGRSVRPTAFALELSRTVGRALADIEALREVTQQAPAGRVRLGITESALTTLLPGAFAELQRRAPQIELKIQRGSTPALLAELKAGRVDMSVLIRPPSGGSARLVWQPLLSDVFVMVVPQALPVMSVVQALRTQPWIRFDREMVAGRLAARFVDRLVANKQALVDVPGIDAIVAMVAAGIGVSVLPKLRTEHLGFAVREIGLGREAPVRHTVMVRRGADSDNRRLDVVQQAFVRVAREGPSSFRVEPDSHNGWSWSSPVGMWAGCL